MPNRPHQKPRPTPQLGVVRALAVACLFFTALTSAAVGQQGTAVELLGSFDAERLKAVDPLEAAEAAGTDAGVGELAKLLYRLERLSPDSLAKRAAGSYRLGDAVEVSGTIRHIDSREVPRRLVELLGLNRVTLLAVDRSSGTDGGVDASQAESGRPMVGDSVTVVTTTLPEPAAVGDAVRGFGVVIESPSTPPSPSVAAPASERAGDVADQRPRDAEERSGDTEERSGDGTRTGYAVAAADLEWTPAEFPHVGWRLLARGGVDLGLLTEVTRRDRQPLMEEDSDVFYTMLAAAARVGDDPPAASPERIEPIELLTEPASHVGRWLRMRIEAVRVTRVSLADQPRRQRQLGRDHYFQIDAVGSLGEVRVQIRASDDRQEPITITDRYPVSVVTTELPDFLRNRAESVAGENAVVAPVSIPLAIDGFFYRLWGYESEFMRRRGGENQFGPLLIAARLENREITAADPVGVSRIGWVAAGVVLTAWLLTVLWSVVTGRRDVAARRRRGGLEPPPGVPSDGGE